MCCCLFTGAAWFSQPSPEPQERSFRESHSCTRLVPVRPLQLHLPPGRLGQASAPRFKMRPVAPTGGVASCPFSSVAARMTDPRSEERVFAFSSCPIAHCCGASRHATRADSAVAVRKTTDGRLIRMCVDHAREGLLTGMGWQSRDDEASGCPLAVSFAPATAAATFSDVRADFLRRAAREGMPESDADGDLPASAEIETENTDEANSPNDTCICVSFGCYERAIYLRYLEIASDCVFANASWGVPLCGDHARFDTTTFPKGIHDINEILISNEPGLTSHSSN